MTLFDLVVRSMRKNIKHYYLYFFALIFAVSLYFIFATLQYDPTVFEGVSSSGSLTSGFSAARYLLVVIIGVFIVYANSIFLRRRSKEIGLYQLIGLTRAGVARLLVIENIFLNIGALLVGVGVGALAARLFVLLLLKLTGIDGGVIALSFSTEAFIATMKVFLGLIAITSLQMILLVYRTSLIQLFRASATTEAPEAPRGIMTAMTAIAGFGFLVFGYWLSQHMLNSFLLVNMLLVLASTIFGTYLLFRVTIGWVFYRRRVRKNGHLSLADSLSLAPLMHRMKGNANSLTLITTLSAMAMTMIAVAYSSFYAAGDVSRQLMPHDFMFDASSEETLAYREETLNEFQRAGIDYEEQTIHSYQVPFQLTGDKLPEFTDEALNVSVVSAAELENTRYPHDLKKSHLHYTGMSWIFTSVNTPTPAKVGSDPFTLDAFEEGNVFNGQSMEATLIVPEERYEALKQYALPESEFVRYAINITNDDDQAEAFALYEKVMPKDDFLLSYYDTDEKMKQSSGMFIFIAGFLGLVFLISTGSILYFKQMSEAEQERQSYLTLRQLGFSVPEMMKGIRRKQLFVYGLPLLVGILHATFAMKSVDGVLFQTDVTIPVIITFVVYSLIYAIFGILTVRYYRHIVKGTL